MLPIPTPAVRPDPERWLEDHGDPLFRYAVRRLGCAEAAEDLVQETLLAALKSLDTFAGRSSERTWLTGILHNKILDRLRSAASSRTRAATDLGDGSSLDALYDAGGHWKRPPGDWGGDPADLLQRREFREAFDRCRDGLPERLRTVISLRYFDDVPAEEVCRLLDITSANLWALLHRARVRLWACMDAGGFDRLPGGDRA